jgi:hypothetical protein
MTLPKHADLIHAFADGKVLQYKQEDHWFNYNGKLVPTFGVSEWRIKPDEPKKAVIATLIDTDDGELSTCIYGRERCTNLQAWGWLHIPELDREVTLPEE